MRLAGHLLCSLWLAVVSLRAPFLHTHADDPAHRHGGFLHAHLAESRPAGAGVESSDEDKPPVWLEWAVSAKSRQAVLGLTLVPRLVVTSPQERAGQAPVFVARSHDPPERSGVSCRAPPR